MVAGPFIVQDIVQEKFTEVHWCERSEYGNKNIPGIHVITPESKDRWDRWRAVLDWYAKKLHSGRAAVFPCQPRIQVFSISEELTAVAAYFSRLLGAHFVQRKQDITKVDSIYVFGKPESMTNRLLTEFRDRFSHTSFLPAIDLPGASFIAAKLLLAGMADKPGNHLICDALASNTSDFSALITPADCIPSSSTELGTVVIQAHGDSAHANVGNVVMCGRVGRKEYLSDGSSIPGCEHRPDSPHCKRKSPKHAGVCVAQDMQAQSMAFLTCNPFTLGDGQYPSTSNLVISALEGYVSAVIAAHCSYIAHPGELTLAERTLNTGETLFQLYLKLRSLRSALNIIDPFVYSGLIHTSFDNPSSGIDVDGNDLAEQQMQTLSISELELALTAWQRMLVQIGRRFSEHLASLRLIALKSPTHSVTNSKEIFLAFENGVSHYLTLTLAFLSEVEHWKINKFGHNKALKLFQQAIRVGKDCDAHLIENLLVCFQSSDYALGEFGKRKSKLEKTSLLCENCGNDLFQTKFSSFLFEGISGYRRTCLTCGAFEIGLPAAGQLSVSASTTWRRGDDVSITATLKRKRDDLVWQQLDWGSVFGFHITHYGHAPYLSRVVGPVSKGNAAINFQCPLEMHPDIYSITVAAILGGRISIKRIRTRCV